MGMSYAEMDPAGAERDRLLNNRIMELRRALTNVPLSDFMAGELPLLARLFGVGSATIYSGEMDVLERHVRPNP